MPGFTRNPLFKAAGKAARDEAVRAFRKTTVGQFLGEAERVAQGQYRYQRLGKLAERYAKRFHPESMLKEMYRVPAVALAAEITRYAKGGGAGAKIVDELFKALGPAGKLLQSLIKPLPGRTKSTSSREVQSALQLLRAFGYEVLPPENIDDVAERGRAVRSSSEFLESMGFKVTPATDAEKSGEQMEPKERGQSRPGRKTVDVEIGGKTRRIRKDDPIITGEFILASNSSNVHSFAYDVEDHALYIRYWQDSGTGAGKFGGGGGGRGGGGGGGGRIPGPMYRYAHVPVEVFERMQRANSKGTFVWDNIRIRGTVSGHRYDYELTGIADQYVPRKATLKPDGEWFVKRQWWENGQTYVSKADQLVRPMVSTGAPNRGTPNRGGPNRGGPNRGRP